MSDFEVLPVDLGQRVPMPDPWSALSDSPRIDAGFFMRAKGWRLSSLRYGAGKFTERALGFWGRGFIENFDAVRFIPSQPSRKSGNGGDPHREFKLKLVGSLSFLAEEFQGVVSSSVWNCIAVLGIGSDPFSLSGVLFSGDRFEFPAWSANAVLGALRKTPDLDQYVASCLYRDTGYSFLYDGDGDLGLWAACEPRGYKPGFLPMHAEMRLDEGLAFFTHLLSESTLAGFLKLPFQMGVHAATS